MCKQYALNGVNCDPHCHGTHLKYICRTSLILMTDTCFNPPTF